MQRNMKCQLGMNSNKACFNASLFCSIFINHLGVFIMNWFQAFILTKKLESTGSPNAMRITSEHGSYDDPDNHYRLITNDGDFVQWNGDGDIHFIGDRDNSEPYYRDEATEQENNHINFVITKVLG